MVEPNASVAQEVNSRLDALDWAQADLANVLGWSVQSVSDLLKGRRRIDGRSAMELGTAIGGDPREWLGLQAEHDLLLASHDPQVRVAIDQIDERAAIERILPVRDLVRRTRLPKGDVAGQYEEACKLLEVESLDQPASFPVVARRANHGDRVSRQQRAWVACAREVSRVGRVGRYSETCLRDLGASLSRSVQGPEDFVDLPIAFASAGVRLVHVEPFAGGRIDGVSTIVDGRPVIALSGRGGRMDKVLYTLAHEAAHVALGHLDIDPLFVASEDDVGDAGLESAADELASAWLVPDLEGLRHGLVTGQRVEDLARRMGVSEAVIIGRLQKEGLIPWNSLLNKRIPSIKEAIRMWS